MKTSCQNELLQPIYPMVPSTPGQLPSTPPAPTQDKIDKCVAEKKQQESD